MGNTVQEVFLWLSFLANIAATYSVALLIFRRDSGVVNLYGGNTPALRILTCVYLSIGLVSLFALVTDVRGVIAWVLFPFQIIYKLLMIPIVGDKKNPVPWFSLAISLLHVVTLAINFDVVRGKVDWFID